METECGQCNMFTWRITVTMSSVIKAITTGFQIFLTDIDVVVKYSSKVLLLFTGIYL